MHNTSKKLTKALREMQKTPHESKPIDLPKTINLGNLTIDKSIASYLKRAQKYSESVKNLSVGEYK